MKPLILLIASSLFASENDLHTQTAAGLIQQHHHHRGVAYWLVDLETGKDLAVNWPDRGAPVAIGSLIKPFAALAYSRTQGRRFPSLACRARECWKPGGHGTIGIAEALAVSCNSYFRHIARDIGQEAFLSVLQRAGLEPPSSDPTPEAMTGFAAGWKVPPAAIIGAYSRLLADSHAALIVTGLEACSRSGTGRAIGKGALAKTGTAPCSHLKRSPGDGYAIVLYPSPKPEVVLLVQAHGQPGSAAAQFAARIVQTLRSGK